MGSPEQALIRTRAVLSKLPTNVKKAIPEWKHEYGILYVQPIDEHTFVFRPATLKELRYAVALSHSELDPEYITPDRVDFSNAGASIYLGNLAYKMTPKNPCLILAQEYLLGRTVLYPTDLSVFDSKPAYIINSLVRRIWDYTRFYNMDEMADLMEQARGVLPTDLGVNMVSYASALLHMSTDELENKSALELVKLVVQAEMLGVRMGMEKFPLAASKKKFGPTQEQLQLSRERSMTKRQVTEAAAAPKTQLMAVDGNLDFIGPAEQHSLGAGTLNIERDKKALADFMRG